MRTPLTVLLVLAFLAGALWAGRTAGSMLRRRVPGSAPAVGRPWPDELAKAYAEESGQKLGQIMQPLRVALTGSTASPSVSTL